jgi:hypothetical protein
MLLHRKFLLGFTASLLAAPVLAAPRGPARPAEYQVKLRYEIPSPRDLHIRIYDRMIEHLGSIGFRYQPGPATDREDPTKNYLTGTIAAANTRKLLADSHVLSVLLTPPGFKWPARETDPVRIELQLVRGFSLDHQRALFNQTASLLEELGFQEAIAYDHRNYTRLLGWFPAGRVDELLKDLRSQPSGWLAPSIPQKELPLPIRNVSPILITEVIAEPVDSIPKALPAPQKPEKGKEELEKVSLDLRNLVAKAEGEGKRVRLEVILQATPSENERGWRRRLERAAPSLIIEGLLGPLVTATVHLNEVPKLAALPEVSTVRLPWPARPQLIPPRASPADNSKALRQLGIYRLGVPRKGARVAVIDGDFRGYQDFVKKKQLPPGTLYVDLTAERNRNLMPDPFPGDPGEVGHGTRCALALATAMAGSGAELVLIRIDPATPYQLQEVARYVSGERYRSASIAMRQVELDMDRLEMKKRRAAINVERKAILDNFSQEPEDLARREAFFKKLRAFEKEERAFQGHEERFRQMERDLRNLRGLQAVACALVWPAGYPVDGSSALSRYFDRRPFCSTLWFQSAGNTRGQAWTGLFRDIDGNGVMEFAPPDAPLAGGRWTRELNFLAWQPYRKGRSPELPAKTRLRITVQWREPHDPEYLRRGEDLYRTPLARLRLVLLRQRDPAGDTLASDDMEEVAQTPGYEDRYGLPQRLDNYPNSATYQQTLEFTVPRAGRYALRVVGKVPASIRPEGVPSLPAFEKTWELRPRLFLEVVDDPSRAAGRPVFLDYATDEGTLGMPADSRGLITVGSADRANHAQSYSATGPAMNLDLLVKPNLLVYDDGRLGTEGAVAYGADLAAGYAAGLAVRSLFHGQTVAQYWQAIQGRPPRVLKVP